jgi:hypothetical protein
LPLNLAARPQARPTRFRSLLMSDGALDLTHGFEMIDAAFDDLA